MKYLIYLFVVLSLLVGGCKSVKVTETTHQHTVKSDTATNRIESTITTIRETEADTTINIMPDSALLVAEITIDENGKANINSINTNKIGERIKQNISIIDNKIYFLSTTDSANIIIKYKNKHTTEKQVIKEVQEVTTIETITDTIKEKITKYRLPGWLWILAAVVLLVIVLRFALK